MLSTFSELNSRWSYPVMQAKRGKSIVHFGNNEPHNVKDNKELAKENETLKKKNEELEDIFKQILKVDVKSPSSNNQKKGKVIEIITKNGKKLLLPAIGVPLAKHEIFKMLHKYASLHQDINTTDIANPDNFTMPDSSDGIPIHHDGFSLDWDSVLNFFHEVVKHFS